MTDIAAAVRSAWEVSGKWEADPSLFGALRSHRETLTEIEAKLARVSDPKTRLTVALQKERDAAAAQVKATEQAVSDRHEAQARALVERSARADEGAIKELTALVREVPAAFPENFATAFTVLQPSDEQLIGCLEVRLTGEE
jgi:hypothetical protein